MVEVEGLNSTDDPQRHVRHVFLTKSPSWIHNQSRACFSQQELLSFSREFEKQQGVSIQMNQGINLLNPELVGGFSDSLESLGGVLSGGTQSFGKWSKRSSARCTDPAGLF